MIRANSLFDKFIRRAALAGLLALATSALVAQAQVFSPAKNLSNNTGHSIFPQIAVDHPAGNINVVWIDNVVQGTPPLGDIFFSRSTDGGATFSTPKALSTAPALTSPPQVALDSSGNINVVWLGVVGGRSFVFFTRSSDGGVTFSTPINLSSILGSAVGPQPQMAVDSTGNVNVVWADETPPTFFLDIYFSRSTDGGVTFTTPTNVSNNGTGFCPDCAGVPQIGVDSAGNINVVWRGLGIGPIDTYFSRSTDGGAMFSPRKRISNGANEEFPDSPRMAVDFSGNIDVVWSEDAFPILGVHIENIFFGRSSDEGATFSAPKNLSNSEGLSRSPQMAVDSGGNINVVWWDNRNGGVFFSRSNDGGTTFSASKSLSDILGSTPQMAVDSSGRINVVWSQGGFPSNIFSSRSIDGGVSFSAPQNLSQNVSSAGCSFRPSVALDSAGNINVVWEGSDPCSVNDIFFTGATTPLPVAKRGHFLVSNRSSSNGLAEFDQNTSLLKTAAFQAQGVSINPLTNSVLVTVPGNPSTEILELDADLNFLRVFANPGGNVNILHLAHNPVANTVIATNHCGLFGGPSAWVFGSTGNQIATINVPTNTCSALGVAVRDDGRYLLGARLDTGIFEYSPTNNFLGVLGNTQSLVSRITGLAIQKSTGNIYVSTEFQGIVVLDGGGTTVIKTITGNGLNEFHGLAFDANENLYVANTASNNILVFDPAGNFVTSFPSGGIEPFQIAFYPISLVPRPSVSSVSPTSGTQGQTITSFTVNGNNFQTGAILSFSGTGINVSSPVVTTTQFTANISIDDAAAVGARDVIVTNPDGQRATLSGGFTVIQAPPPPQPAINVSPSQIVFPPTLLHQNFRECIKIKNPGTATLLISSITAPSPFVLVGQPTSIPAGGEDNFCVDFFAVNAGPFSGDLVIVSNALTSPTLIPLLGTVILPDLSVSDADITPIQAVKSPDIDNDNQHTMDLVLGRPTVVRVRVSINNPEAIASGQLVDVQLSFGSSVLSESRTASSLLIGPVDFFFTPSQVGDFPISITVDPNNLITEITKTNNQASQFVTVKAVRDVRYAYMRVDYLAPTQNFETTVFNSADYLLGVYPLAPAQFFAEPLDSPFVPAPAAFLPNSLGAIDDALNLWLDGQLLTPAPERVVSIVPEQWFIYHGLGTTVNGVFIPDAGDVFPLVGSVAFVTDGMPLVSAHELGHTYGFGEGYVLLPDHSCCLSDGQSTSGYWVQRRREVTDSVDYMGDSPGPVSYPDQATLRWSTVDRFADLFRQFRTQPKDPEVLLVTGTIGRDGAVTLGAMYRVLNAVASQPSTGDAAVRVLDINGNVLAELPFSVDFRILSDPPRMLDVAPFAFAVPYPLNAAQVQIVRTGQVLARTSLTPKLLRDAVASIPDAGFVRDPSQLRNALQNKIIALDAQLASGDFADARDKLQNDIRKTLVDWLRDDYLTRTPRQYTKSGILELVDELLQRLRSFIT